MVKATKHFSTENKHKKDHGKKITERNDGLGKTSRALVISLDTCRGICYTVAMIKIPEHPRHHKNSEKCTDGSSPCVVCGKPIRHETAQSWVVVVDGGTCLEHPDDADPNAAGYLGGYPIGKGCLRRHPELKPYVQE